LYIRPLGPQIHIVDQIKNPRYQKAVEAFLEAIASCKPHDIVWIIFLLELLQARQVASIYAWVMKRNKCLHNTGGKINTYELRFSVADA
jgi:hypothetical protein